MAPLLEASDAMWQLEANLKRTLNSAALAEDLGGSDPASSVEGSLLRQVNLATAPAVYQR